MEDSNEKIRVIAIIQARMNASRLPNKPLLNINGKPLLQHTVEGLEKVSNIDKVIVATSDTTPDDAIEEFCKKKDINYYRGSEEDVLERFVDASKKFSPQYVIRICGDEPILDTEILEKAIKEHMALKVEYSTTIHNTLYGAVPKGLDIEIINYDILEKLNRIVKSKEEREHVTKYILNNPDKFKIHRFKFDKRIARRDICITVDTKDDLEFIERLYIQLEKEKPKSIANKIVELIDNKVVQRKPGILLRADASKDKGIGDVITLIHIADYLKDKYECIFASKNYPNAIDLIKKNGYEIFPLELDWEKDKEIIEIRKYCEYKKIKYCIVEFYPNNPDYVKSLSAFLRTMMVDFHGDIEVYSDILLCWDLFSDENKYEIINRDVKKLLGPNYVPLSKNFTDYQKNKNNEKLVKITICAGGGEPYNLMQKIKDSISEIKNKYEFTFICGPDFENIHKFNEFNIINSPKDIYEIFSESDLVISGGGFTSFELCALGVPFIGISKLPWEIRRLKKMESLGICDFINIDKDLNNNLVKKIKNLEDVNLRNTRSKKGKELVDGKGTQRIADEVKGIW